jgi:hypothetical protein
LSPAKRAPFDEVKHLTSLPISEWSSNDDKY